MITRRALLQSASAGLAMPSRPDDPARLIFEWVNRRRIAQNLPPLAWADDIARCAQEQSERKVLLRFRGHEDPERGGVDLRLNRAGVPWDHCAENVFQMRGYEEVANFAVVFWWYSPGHRQNMLTAECDQTGVGIAHAEDGTWFATQIFIKRRGRSL